MRTASIPIETRPKSDLKIMGQINSAKIFNFAKFNGF